VRGDPVRHPGGTAIDLRQGKSTLRILSFEDLSCEAITEPEQIDVGTGCPPESYALFWGPPFHRVAVRKRRILDAAQRAGWITLFVTGGEAKVEPAGAAPDAWPQRLVVTVPEGTDRIEIGDEILARLTRHAAGRRDTVWEIRDR
jgi:hypothetical protein